MEVWLWSTDMLKGTELEGVAEYNPLIPGAGFSGAECLESREVGLPRGENVNLDCDLCVA